jgi:hypothetical protein
LSKIAPKNQNIIKNNWLALDEKITRSRCEHELAHPDVEEQTDADKVGDE